MARNREERPPRKMKPIYIVFCEGETEEMYVHFLRQNYRSPIKIITNVLGNEITSNVLQKKIDDMKIFADENFTLFLMYDLDVSSVNSKLEKITATKLLSNPCIELWFLLHSLEKTNPLTSDGCLKKLRQCGNEWKTMKKEGLRKLKRKFCGIGGLKPSIMRRLWWQGSIHRPRFIVLLKSWKKNIDLIVSFIQKIILFCRLSVCSHPKKSVAFPLFLYDYFKI